MIRMPRGRPDLERVMSSIGDMCGCPLSGGTAEIDRFVERPQP
jgi:hypothetical protein